MKSLILAIALFVPFFAVFAQQPQVETEEFVRARLAADDGDFDDAIRLMNRLLEKSPSDPILLYERVLMFLDSGKLDEADRDLRKIVSFYPEFVDAQRLLGRLTLDRGPRTNETIQAALVHLRAAYRAAPDDLQTGLMIVQVLLSANDDAGAAEILAQLSERAPDHRSINFNYAQVLTKLGRDVEAREALERTVASDPTFGPAIFQLVEHYRKSQEWLKAADALQPLVEQEDSNLDLRRQQAFYYLRGGAAEKAKTRFEEVLTVEPQDNRSRYFLAESFSSLGEFSKADQVYEKLLAETPNDADLLLSYGLSLVAQQRREQARSTFETLLSLAELEPNVSTFARTQLALIDYHDKKLDDALAKAIGLIGEEAQINLQAVNLALEIYEKQKRTKEALDLVHRLYDKNPNEPFLAARYVELLLVSGERARADDIAAKETPRGKRSVIGIAESYVDARVFDAAIEILRKAHQANSDDLDYLFQLGSVYERSGDIKKAEETFLELLTHSGDHAPTLNYLGYMWADRGVNLERAAGMLEEAVRQQPRNGAFVDSLGWVYFRLGRFEQAQKHLTDASKLMPRDPTIQIHLGDLFVKMGLQQKALEKYREALQLEPDTDEQQQLRAKIAELEQSPSSPR